ncbi:hypothetical protein [Psychrobacillus sp. FSL K6-1415]|uniref:hypothetical protein n=1 Tax=Psychrobacillus sp. FSL K6-1415 TaxID=2921544 RepID=UPI0030F744DA
MTNKIVTWALFDSGNGCYFNGASNFANIEVYSIGLDIENKNNHFINLNLADYSYLFGDKTLYETLDNLPKPDLIIASPPCESWSVASAMDKGNACWKQEQGDSLFEPQTPLSRFTIRDYKDYERYQFKPEKSLVKRINGELCTVNLIQIIKKYNPTYFIIENPASSKIWDYIEKILGFEIPYENLTYYNNYDDYPVKKPTKFKSNLQLNLKSVVIPNKIEFCQMAGYNNRSNIPQTLVNEIFARVIEEYTQKLAM